MSGRKTKKKKRKKKNPFSPADSSARRGDLHRHIRRSPGICSSRTPRRHTAANVTPERISSRVSTISASHSQARRAARAQTLWSRSDRIISMKPERELRRAKWCGSEFWKSKHFPSPQMDVWKEPIKYSVLLQLDSLMLRHSEKTARQSRKRNATDSSCVTISKYHLLSVEMT